jgi:CheY-like chemotaxis protein
VAELVTALEPLGLNLTRTAPGPDLSAVLEQGDFAVALVGMYSGGPDPADTIATIHEHVPVPLPPVLIVSESANNPPATDAYTPGVVDCLSRPIPEAILRAKVNAFIELQRQSTEELCRTLGAKDAYLALLVQELREPLETIRERLAQLEQATFGDVRAAEIATSVGGDVRRVGRLVDDAIAAPGPDSMPPSIDRLDLARIVRMAARDRRRLLAQAGLRLNVSTTMTPLWIRGERTRAELVVRQLLDLVAKRAESGGAVTIAAEADPGKGVAVVRLNKTTIGHGPEFTARRLERPAPFDRPDAGLMLLRAIVERGGGAIITDDPDLCSPFTLTIPIAGEPPALRASPGKATTAARRRRVLVIEDNRDAAASLSVLLELMGHDVRVAYTGPEGVAAAAEWPPEIVISDIGLPGFDGFEVARRLRRQLGTKPLIVALTGYGRDEDRRHSREAGFDHHLVKPADPAVLQQMLASER